MIQGAEEDGDADRNPIGARNAGKPILLTDINIAGVSASAARSGETVEVWTRLTLTSNQQLFHDVVNNLASVIEHSCRQVGSYVSLERAHTVFLVIRPDNSGELWVDAAAMYQESKLKRPGPLKAGTVLFENDIGDITGMWFPLVKVEPKDRVICLFRVGWHFGLFMDCNPEGDLSIPDAKRDLARLYRHMRYADLYSVVTRQPDFRKLVDAGWFPFLELMAGEFMALAKCSEAGFELSEEEGKLVEKFKGDRLERMFNRWMERTYLKEKELILRPAINAFKADDPVSVIKNVLSEIEGVMAEAHFHAKGERTHRIGKLLAFMVSLAEQRAGGRDTLFFPVEFGTYLEDYIYAGFRPGDKGSAGSRHAVGHGAVRSDQYTMTRALQALLTLDQLAFYL